MANKSAQGNEEALIEFYALGKQTKVKSGGIHSLRTHEAPWNGNDDKRTY